MTAQSSVTTSGRRWRVAGGITAAVVVVGLLAAVIVGGVQMQRDVDDLERQLAATERDLSQAQRTLDELEAAAPDEEQTSARIDALVFTVGSLRDDQQALSSELRSLADGLDSLENRGPAQDPTVFRDLRVLEGCLSWLVGQVRQMANGSAPDSLAPNDCRLLA